MVNSAKDRKAIKQEILQLAHLKNIKLVPENIDWLADKFSELSGNAVQNSDIISICVNLARNNRMSKKKALEFVRDYIKAAA